MTRRTSATRSCASRSAATGTASRSRSRRWPTCPPAPAWARRARTQWRCSNRSRWPPPPRSRRAASAPPGGGGPPGPAPRPEAPAGTGRGSSGAYTVAVLKSLALARHRSTTPASLAEDACHIEIDVLGEPVGKQDQYVAAHGGICAYTFRRDGSVEVEPLDLSAATLENLRRNLLLFYTGEARSASQLLADQVQRTEADDAAMLSNLDRTKEIGLQSRELLERGDLAGFAELMDAHW